MCVCCERKQLLQRIHRQRSKSKNKNKQHTCLHVLHQPHHEHRRHRSSRVRVRPRQIQQRSSRANKAVGGRVSGGRRRSWQGHFHVLIAKVSQQQKLRGWGLLRHRTHHTHVHRWGQVFSRIKGLVHEGGGRGCNGRRGRRS